MTEADRWDDPRLDRLEVLTFQLEGVRMAADVEQLLEMRDPEHAELAAPLTGIPRTPGPSPGFQAPKLLVLRGQGYRRVVTIDRPGDVLTLPVDSIQPMPALVAACVGARPFWGAVILDGSPVLLVDLDEFVSR